MGTPRNISGSWFVKFEESVQMTVRCLVEYETMNCSMTRNEKREVKNKQTTPFLLLCSVNCNVRVHLHWAGNAASHTVNWFTIRRGNYDNAQQGQKKRKEKWEHEKVSKMLCIAWSEIVKENENKGLLHFNQAFPCSETVSHSLALRVKWVIWLTFGEKQKITQQEEDNWQANCCVGINRNEGAGQQEHLSSQHQQFFCKWNPQWPWSGQPEDKLLPRNPKTLINFYWLCVRLGNPFSLSERKHPVEK